MPLGVVDVFAPGGEQFVVHEAIMVLQASLSPPDLRGKSDGKVVTRRPIDYSDTQGIENPAS